MISEEAIKEAFKKIKEEIALIKEELNSINSKLDGLNSHEEPYKEEDNNLIQIEN